MKCKLEDIKKPSDPCLQQFPVTAQLSLSEDKSISSAKVHVGKSSKNPVKRSDSVKHRKPSMSVKGDFTGALSTQEEFTLQSGENRIILTKRVDRPGFYRVGQLSLLVESKMEFMSLILEPRLCYSVRFLKLIFEKILSIFKKSFIFIIKMKNYFIKNFNNLI